MMNKTASYFKLLAGIAFMLTLAGCSKDDPAPVGKFATGVFVVNEGNFGSADGTISFFDRSSAIVQQDIFGLQNGGKALGDVVQSMTIAGDNAYMVVNNNNKVEVADANTMVSTHTITGVLLPRYFITFNGKGYLTEWVSFSRVGRVDVINLETNIVEDTIRVGSGAENIIEAGNKLYVSNNFTNTVSVIDPVEKSAVTAIEVASAPGAFVIDKNNLLWVICGGDFDADNGALVSINITTGKVVNTIDLGRNVTPKLAINGSMDQLYYFDETHVYQIAISATAAPTSAFISEANAISFYGIGIDPLNGDIYAGDNKAFSGNGIVYRYSSSGSPIGNFTSGRGPNGFVFR